MKAYFAFAFALVLMSVVYAGTGGPSPVPSPPGYSISTSNPVLCRGTTNNVQMLVTNLGRGNLSAMQNIQLGVTSSKSVLSSTISAGTISANTTKAITVPVFVNANASSLIQVTVLINYYYYTYYTDSETQNVTFQVQSCGSPLSVKVSPLILQAGGIQNLTINFTNSGNTSLRSIIAYAGLPSADAALLTPMPMQIPSIAPHTSVLRSISAYVFSTASTAFPVNVSGSYYSGNALNEILNSTELLSSGIINLSASSIAISPSSPSAGGVLSISFILTNIGTSSATAVSAEPILPPGFTSFGSNSVFVGDIAADSQSPVTVTLVTESSLKSGNYNVPIKLNYLNSLRYNVSKTIYVPVQVSKLATNDTTRLRTQSGSGEGLLVLVLIIVIIALALLFYRERKSIRKHLKAVR